MGGRRGTGIAACALLALLLFAAPASAGWGTFATPAPFTAVNTGGQDFVRVADADGDGDLDVEMGNVVSPQVSVAANDGTGVFPAVDVEYYEVGAAPYGVAVADFNRDGRPDLAVANNNSDNISLLRGAVGGGFREQRVFPAGSNPYVAEVGDMNRDGDPDLVVSDFGNSKVEVFLGDGRAHLTRSDRVNVPSSTYELVLADFNRDGRLDVATANYDSGSVSVLTGDGHGGLGQRREFATGALPNGIAAGDFNRDGKLDLATSNEGDETVSLLRGRGDGTFRPAREIDVGADTWRVIAADFNRDGNLDLAVGATAMMTSVVEVLPGNGDATFGASSTYETGGTIYDLAAGNLNGDNGKDIVVQRQTGFVVLLNQKLP